MADYGLKISKSGYDVKTAAVKDLIITSKANQWKIHMTGTVSGTGPINVAHSLGYTPGYLGADYHTSGALSGKAEKMHVNTRVDSTNLVLYPPSTGYTRYFILKDLGA